MKLGYILLLFSHFQCTLSFSTHFRKLHLPPCNIRLSLSAAETQNPIFSTSKPFEKFLNELDRCKSVLYSKRSGLVKLSIWILVAIAFRPLPSLAKSNPANPSLITKLIDGVTVSDSDVFRKMKAGDTRTEFAAAINGIGSLVLFFGLGCFAYILHTYNQFKWNYNYNREKNKTKEYKEAVQEILTKLEDPKLKGSTKANLQKQLKDLDPDGVIAKFLAGEGGRPDLSDRIDVKPTKKASSTSADKKATPKKPTNPSSKSIGKSGVYEGFYQELYLALKEVLSESNRRKVVENIKSRLEKITDAEKKKATISKIRSKFNDKQYWVDFSSNLN